MTRGRLASPVKRKLPGADAGARRGKGGAGRRPAPPFRGGLPGRAVVVSGELPRLVLLDDDPGSPDGALGRDLCLPGRQHAAPGDDDARVVTEEANVKRLPGNLGALVRTGERAGHKRLYLVPSLQAHARKDHGPVAGEYRGESRGVLVLPG